MKEQRSKLGSPGLIVFVSCNLPIVHSAFKSGAETGGWNLKKWLKLCFHLLRINQIDVMFSLVSQNRSSTHHSSVQPGFLKVH